MTLEELKTGMREYFKKYKSQMTSKERKEFQSAKSFRARSLRYL